MLNLEWFRTFKVIYEVGSLTAAAEALFISQPGVSLHLNSLEAYTGYRLFERDNRKCVPTDRATILYNFIIDPLVKLEGIENEFHRGSRTARPTVSIGMCCTTFQQILVQHVAQLPFNLIARFGEASQLIDDLNNGAIDFVLTSQNKPMPNIVYTPFQKQRIVLVCGKDTDTSPWDKLISSDDLDGARDWLKQQVWFATSTDMEYLKNFWLTNFGSPPDFQPGFVLPDFGSILQCLKNCDGFAVVPDFLFKEAIADDQVKLAWEGSSALEQTLHFGRRKKTAYAKELEHLEELLAKNWFSEACLSG